MPSNERNVPKGPAASSMLDAALYSNAVDEGIGTPAILTAT